MPRKPKPNDISKDQWQLIIIRDGRCLSCGARYNLTPQHRVSRGMGGLGTRAQPLTCADGIILCWDCNVAAEGPMQSEAIQHGWKVPRNSVLPARLVPVFDRLSKIWYYLDPHGNRRFVPSDYAEDLCLEVYNTWKK